MVSRKRAVVTVLFTMFSDMGDSSAVLLNFHNFRNFRNQCFAKFCKSCFASIANTSFQRLRITQFTFVSQDSQGFASFRKYKFRKVSQIGFSFRKVSQVLQGFRNGQFADAFLVAAFSRLRPVGPP